MFDGLEKFRTHSFRKIPGTPEVKIKAKADISSGLRRRLFRIWFRHYGPHCLDCGCKMFVAEPNTICNEPDVATIDHIRARALGGTNMLGNLRVVCRQCNMDKSCEEALLVPLYRKQRKRMLRARARKALQTRRRRAAKRLRRAERKARIRAEEARAVT